ncbi:hypothetical protein QL285_086417 [Trifolium repens]|nr:hypothetical protein QL285_086417 [Trifolium repens]
MDANFKHPFTLPSNSKDGPQTEASSFVPCLIQHDIDTIPTYLKIYCKDSRIFSDPSYSHRFVLFLDSSRARFAVVTGRGSAVSFHGREDKHSWIPNAAGLFLVNSSYTFLQNRFEMDDIDTDDERALKKLWLNDVPSEVSIFGWRLLSEKLPTREALARQGQVWNHIVGGWGSISFSMMKDDTTLIYLEQWQRVKKGRRSSPINFS